VPLHWHPQDELSDLIITATVSAALRHQIAVEGETRPHAPYIGSYNDRL